MADIEYPGETRADDAHPEAGGSSFGFIVNVLGAMTSLALVVGVGVWGYWLVMRDVSGVPVVRALEGPLRVQPENPGGEPADYQGLAVNAVAAQGAASPPADRLTLAPRPVDLSEEDQPMGRIEPAAADTPTARAPDGGGEPGADSTGSEMSDAAIAALVDSPAGRIRTRTLIADAARSPEIGELVSHVWVTRFALGREVIERGIARGELRRDIPPATILATFIGPLYVRLLITDERIDDAFIQDVIEAGLTGSQAAE